MPGQQLILQQSRSADMSVELIAFAWDVPFEQLHCSSDLAILNMCLTPRPDGACGRYEGPWHHDRFERLGEMIFLPRGVPMRARAGAGRQHALQLGFAPGLLPVDEGWSRERLRRGLDLHGPRIREGCRRIASELIAPGFASAVVIDAAMRMLAIDLARQFHGLNAAELGPFSGGLGPSRIRTIDERLDQPGAPPSVTELAALCGISRRHLARAFRQETGTTISDHIARRRLDRAKGMLRGSAMPIKRIAAELGFAQTSAFSAAFRAGTGVSPRTFRREVASQ